MNLVVIICHYKENLDWVSDINHRYLIYNKNPNDFGKYDFDMENYGFDTIVYLKYIIDNYENLPDYVCFSQDNPFYHCPKFIKKINNFKGDVSFYPLGVTYIRDVESILNKTKEYANQIGIDYLEPIKFINSAQCIVSKELIRKRPKEIYEKIKNSLNTKQVITEINYYIEYLWPTILSFNDELQISFNNC